MRRLPVILCSLWACLSGASLAEQTFDAHGFKFQYRDSDKVAVIGEKTKTIRVEDPSDSTFIIQNHGASISPPELQKLMLEKLMEQLGADATQYEHKAAVRTLLGKPRNGTYILYNKKNNIPREALLFIFNHNKQTICVITQMSLQHSKEAERMFALIQNSLTLTN